MTRVLLAAGALLIAIVIAVALSSPADAHAAGPGGAARATAACLAGHGWAARARGRTVVATSPRVRPANAFPRRPRFEVTYSDAPFEPVQVLWALNDREHRTVARCLRRTT